MGIKSELHEAILKRGGKVPPYGGIAAAMDELNKLPGGGGDCDWNIMKNKPFDIDKGETILSETAVEFSADAPEAYLPDVLPIEVGKAYCVNWNGVDYLVTAESDDSLGVTIPALNSDGVFRVMCLDAEMAANMGIGTGVVALDGSVEVTISIYAATVHALPAYYLPKMTVNVTVDGSGQGNHAADKTPKELTSAIKAGYIVECRFKASEHLIVLPLNRFCANQNFPYLLDTEFSGIIGESGHYYYVSIVTLPNARQNVKFTSGAIG